MQTGVFFVSTPIGNLNDISIRAKQVLEKVDCILCEDTRVSSKLLSHLGIKARLEIYNDHNAQTMVSKVITSIKDDRKTYALISDAGTPMISDPGYKLVNACIANEVGYTVIPGSCAAIAALTLSGLPSNRFLLAGFVNRRQFSELAHIDATLIFFESPQRLTRSLNDMVEYFNDRVVAVVREITKIHEESIRGSLVSLISHFTSEPPRGEFVIVVAPPDNANGDSRLAELSPLVDQLIDMVPIKLLSTILSKNAKISRSVAYRYLSNYVKDREK
ncbi:MAG: 16S rRNA (cytidine(1402)-2'-O)-methyltransferase [Holosporales bacterium]|jgi:16S rRNA (cytidine1402-2'-O)-methyltransferase|nr:16S rRNA (cytidine(1402)-2'-O)-methyltransferase [Holosporales bacterium]